MAAATMANNALALVFTVLFARLLGATDYGSLPACGSIAITEPAACASTTVDLPRKDPISTTAPSGRERDAAARRRAACASVSQPSINARAPGAGRGRGR